MSDYFDRTLVSIAEHCGRRGIPEPEVESVRAELAKKFGKALDEMTDGELRNVNRALPLFLTEYLDGQKRRPLSPTP